MMKFIHFLLLIFITTPIFSQLRLDTLKWQPPLDIPILLSGNFAELRSNHFHAGIDMKTQGKEGFKVYAAQSGYVSRIKVASGGYGKALYITHPDGYTSVYAHLKEYNIQIDRYVRKVQYAKKSFSVDIYPRPYELSVTQGDIVGLSGNTGSSGGPHLHFEIRKTATSIPLNGLFLKYDIKDTIAPKMKYLYLYLQKNTEKDDAKIFSLQKSRKRYKVKHADTLNVYGDVAFGLKVDDFLNNSANKCGVYVLNMFVDGELYHKQQYDEFSFYETRYINALMDYKENIYKKRKLYKLYKQPNNRVSIIKKATNRGVVQGKKGEVKQIKIEAIDAYGNKSTLNFAVRFMSNKNILYKNRKNTITIPWQKKVNIDTMGVRMSFEPNTFYDTAFVKFKKKQIDKDAYSATYTIGDEHIAIHKRFSLEIPCYVSDSNLYDKLVLAKLDKRKNKYFSVGGLYIDGMLKVKIRNFGTYKVLIDTTLPTIKPMNLLRNKTTISRIRTFNFFIHDNFSGISSYNGSINGNWVLFEWDPKTHKLTYNADDYLPKTGNCLIKLEVYDGRGNKAIFEKNYTINQ